MLMLKAADPVEAQAAGPVEARAAGPVEAQAADPVEAKAVDTAEEVAPVVVQERAAPVVEQALPGRQPPAERPELAVQAEDEDVAEAAGAAGAAIKIVGRSLRHSLIDLVSVLIPKGFLYRTKLS